MTKRLHKLKVTLYLIICTLILVACSASSIRGVNSFIDVQEGKIKVTDARMAQTFTAGGTTIEARDGYTLVIVDFTARGSVPLAGISRGYNNPVVGDWTLMDGDENFYQLIVRAQELVFEVKEPATGLVLWLGDNIALPLGTYFNEPPAVVRAPLNQLRSTAAPEPTEIASAPEDEEAEDSGADEPEEETTDEPEQDAAETVEAADLACVTCHTDEATLQELAVEEEDTEALSEGEG